MHESRNDAFISLGKRPLCYENIFVYCKVSASGTVSGVGEGEGRGA